MDNDEQVESPNTRTDFPGGIDDETLAALLGDAATVLRRAKLGGLARAVELSSVILFGKPAHGEPFVEDIATALDACDRLVDALGDLDDDELTRLGIDGNVAEAGQALAYCAQWGLDPNTRTGNALRVLAREIESIRLMARDGVAAEHVQHKAEALLDALGIGKASE